MPPARAPDYGFQSGRYAQPPVMARPHRHQEIELNILARGRLDYLLNGALRRIEAGRIFLFWAAVPHQLVRAEGARDFIWLTVPLAWVLAWSLPPAWVGRLLAGEVVVASPDAADGGRLAEWHAALRRRNPAWERLVALEAQARMLRLALERSPAEALAEPGASGRLKKVEQLARCLATRFREPLTIPDIAAAAGLHPNYAMNLFRTHCGQTLGECLTQHRVAHAQRLLATTDDKIVDVAFASGFGSANRFYAAFHKSCGQTPRAYRTRTRSR